uniref:transposon-transfer assisting family protein n=1 Tax=Enterocloster clostridioformis TaxID=1531 RepID=UPI002431CEFB|nr:transposon-transfer assisting family protein [Enterocloster clostridioformis]
MGGRKNVINGINKTLKHLEDDEMVELSLCVLAKLKELTDHEFMKMEFVAAE